MLLAVNYILFRAGLPPSASGVVEASNAITIVAAGAGRLRRRAAIAAGWRAA